MERGRGGYVDMDIGYVRGENNSPFILEFRNHHHLSGNEKKNTIIEFDRL